MTSTDQFLALETDADAIKTFDAARSAATRERLCDAAYDADVAAAIEALRGDDHISSVTRRGAWLYSYLVDEAHPKGLWRRVLDGTPPTPKADWQTVFDLDAFCAETGEDWHWQGAETAWSDPARLLLRLSFQGSDRVRYLEWDADRAVPVPGGFDLGPERNAVSWLDADTLLYSTSGLEGAATRSGWPGRVLKLSRGQALKDAPVLFEADHNDLLAYGHALPELDGRVAVVFGRVRAIGDTEKTYHPDGLDSPAHILPTPRNATAIVGRDYYAHLAADEGPHPAGTLVLTNIKSGQARVLFDPAPYKAVDANSVYIGARWMFWVETDRMQPQLRGLDLGQADAEPFNVALPVAAEEFYLGSLDAEMIEDGPFLLNTSGFLMPGTSWVMRIGDTSDDISFEPFLTQPARFDGTGMEVQLHSAISADGTEVPYHIVLPKDRDGPVPVLQYGYGGFGVALSPSYQMVTGPLWLAKGGAYVLAYIRGGGEFGASWHLAAKGDGRDKAFADFAAVADDLVARGYTTSDKIACHGGSNGGLLCSVMLTRYPEKFGAVWASVAVTDMLRFHLFPAGAGWIDEYGDPDDPTDAAMLQSYSPMHNIAPQQTKAYPAALISTGESDDRVDPSHSRRFAAALEAVGQPVLYHAATGGHGGGGSIDRYAADQALGISFLRNALGV